MTTKKNLAQLLQALTAAGGSARESELRAATGWEAEHLAIVLEDARERLLARPVATKPQQDTAWVAVDVLIARCPWKPAHILKAIASQEMSTRELARLAKSPEVAMGLVLRRMARAKRIKLAAFDGLRKWVPFERHIAPGGSRPEPYDGDLLALIAKHQPMRLEHLVQTCETPGCCNHDHHKQVTRSAAMRKAFAAIGFGGEKHGRLVSAAIRHKVGSLSPEQVELIRTSPLTGAELARQLGKTKSVVQDVRAGRSYREYPVASPFAGLGGRSAC